MPGRSDFGLIQQLSTGPLDDMLQHIEIQANRARAHQEGEVADVRGLGEEGEGLADGHVGLGLLLLGLAGLDSLHHSALQQPVGGGDEQAADDHHAHHALQRVAPAVDTWRQA